MNANESMSVSLYGKMTAVFVVVLLAFSSFTLLASAGPNDEQENEADSGITLGEAVLAPSEEGVEAYHVANMVVPDQEEPIVTVMADGSFKPARQDAGQAKILLVDDDGENWMSGPWLEASHIATALNDGGYSYDVYRAGRWGGTPKELPGGDTGLSMLDDYEAIIWYSGWNTQIFSSSETGILGEYLDGHCGSTDSEFGDGDFCVPATSRNMILSTQMTDWVDAYSGGFENQYFHSDTQSSSYLIVDGTSNPMKGVDDSIFEGEELATDSAGLHYLDRPCGIKPYDDTAIGAFWYDAHKDALHGHEWHAVQFPGPNYAGGDGQQDGLQDHKAFHFADEIGVFNLRSDRAKFFSTILSWMEVTQETTKNVDIGIGGVDIPNHVQYWRSVEAMVPVDIKITVTNYGMLPQASTAVHLKLKNEFGQVLFDSTFDTRAFPEGHAMHIPDQISPGDSVIFTFNKENDRLQRIYDGVNENNARDVIFTSAGMDKIVAEVVHAGDQGSPNNYVQAEVGIGKWIENGEHPDNEIGPSITFGDETGGTHANSPSLDHVNFHRTTSYDTDADGCGWAVDADTCLANGGTLNKTYGTVFMEGESSLGMATSKGWYKSGSDKSCQWGSSSLSDSGCPKFTMEPNQDDWFVSPPLDLSAMDEVVVGMLFSGCMESGDYFRMQISKDGTTWTNLISYTGFCPGEGAWYLWGGSNAKYQGYTLASSWYGEGAETVWWRVQADADNDQNTESSSRPYNGWWIDEIVFRGTEQITRDVAISDITVDNDFAVTDNKGSSLWREINATLVNAGESDWTSVGVQFSVTDMQGYDHSGLLEGESLNEQQIATVQNLDGDSIYGNFIAKPEENELFAVFGTPEANTYTATVEALVPEARDYFPWNNSLSVQFRVFDTFFYDNVDDARTYIDDKGTEDSSDDTTVPIYAYTKVERQSTSDNEWKMRDINNNAYSGEMIWQYSKDGDTSTYGAGADDSLVTQDMYDRDGHTGTEFALDVNIDLRAAFKPYLGYALKWDFADGDRLEVRAAADFDSDQAMSSGTWTVLKTYDGKCSATDWVQEGGNPCTWDSSESEHWVVEELSLEAFEGYQTWIDFRVVTATGGGTEFKGVQLDDIMVIGNEYRNNLAIVDVTTERYAASGEAHDLSITVRGVGREPQEDIVVKATMTDSNGIRVWPGDPDQPFQFTTIPVELGKGEEYTIDPTTAGTDWIWGFTGEDNDVPLSPGIYYLRIEAKRAQDTGVGEGTSDENPSDNVRTISIVIGATLLNGDQWGDGEGETPDIRTGAEMGDGWSKGSYVWDGIQNGDLTSDVFEVWNEKPFLVVEAEYDLTDAVVIAQVRAGSSGAWYDIHWRAADQLSTLYSIPGDNRTDLPDSWTGSSSFDNATKQTFFADLGVVEDLTNSEGTALQDKYVGGTMQIRLRATNTGSGDAGTFTAFYPCVFGLGSYEVAVKSIDPPTQSAEPSSSTGDFNQITYNVKTNNFGASADYPVVDFVMQFPGGQGSLSVLTVGSETFKISMESILQVGPDTAVTVRPTGTYWGGAAKDPNRDGDDDNQAYLFADTSGQCPAGGIVEWPSGATECISPTGWAINNPTKSSWDNAEGKPVEPINFADPGSVVTTAVTVQVGVAEWAPPGEYYIQVNARSWADYDNTFTSCDGADHCTASMNIEKPDLQIGSDVRYIAAATGFGEQGSGWIKQTGGDDDPYFSFMFEVLNDGTETVGSFKVGLLNDAGIPLAAIQVGIYWTNSGWLIDDTKTTAEGAEIIVEGNKKYISFKATAAQLGMSQGPGDANSGTYNFYLAVDTEEDVAEENENNNRVPITITTVREVNTVPSFSLSLMSMTLSGLLAAVGIALRQKEEE